MKDKYTINWNLSIGFVSINFHIFRDLDLKSFNTIIICISYIFQISTISFSSKKIVGFVCMSNINTICESPTGYSGQAWVWHSPPCCHYRTRFDNPEALQTVKTLKIRKYFSTNPYKKTDSFPFPWILGSSLSMTLPFLFSMFESSLSMIQSSFSSKNIVGFICVSNILYD